MEILFIVAIWAIGCVPSFYVTEHAALDSEVDFPEFVVALAVGLWPLVFAVVAAKQAVTKADDYDYDDDEPTDEDLE